MSMPSSKIMNASESRHEPRFPFPGGRVDIRRAGWKAAGGYHAHRLVDLSPNGLAFVAHDSSLEPLDKIGFRLRLGACEAEGRAVVCYRRAEGGGIWRYGTLFLEVTPDIEVLLRETEVDPAEVRAVARALAEEMVLARCGDAEERARLRRQMLLQEAVDAWLGRLRELGWRPPLAVTAEREGLRIEIEGADPVAIRALAGRPGFAGDGDRYFASVFEVLEFLRTLVGPEGRS